MNRYTVLLLMGCVACATPETPIHEREIVDLTWTLDETTIAWPTSPGFTLETQFDGITDGGWYYLSHIYHGPEHGGTHIDAPIHFHEGRDTTDEIPLTRLIGPGVKIDLRHQAADDRDYRVGLADFERWERAHGELPEGAIVLLDTGFADYWPDRRRYMGTDGRGQEAVADLRFPGLDPATVDWLVGTKKIRAIGIDTASIDYGQSTDFAAHVALMEHNVPVFENLARLDRLPPRDFTVVALPAKIGGGSGGPLRIIALLEG
ncbi:MAG TPA: cyclase family protein [Candidatus Polarisedimenticolaceae bacterium]|nr:cyclase family protein [Candidatus Polarisedimenticolaceae bacterium]